MQRCNCTVRLAGDMGNTVQKTGVSPAEIVILRMLHGGYEAVTDIQPTSMDKVPHAQERARLYAIYKQEVVEAAFPGAFGPLPVSLRDIDGNTPEEEDLPADEDDDVPAGDDGTVERMEAMDPKPDEDDLTEDDHALIAMIQEAKSEDELLVLADENEVDRKMLTGKLDDKKIKMIRSLFPMHKG